MGGRRLHLLRGGAGTPTVVFEAGGGLLAYSWMLVMEGVNAFASTAAWDRPGYGWSDRPSSPLSLDSVVGDLHELLRQAAVPPPYVMVGHSIGGFYVRHFAARHPDIVCGMVLVDPSHELMLEGAPRATRIIAPLAIGLQSRAPGLVARMSRKKLRKAAVEAFPALDAEDLKALVELHLRPETLRLQMAEVRDVLAESQSLLGAPGSLGSMPLVVLGAGKLPGGEAFRRHREGVQLRGLLALSSNSRLEIVSESGHGIPLESPSAVVEAVRDVVDQAREGLPKPH